MRTFFLISFLFVINYPFSQSKGKGNKVRIKKNEYQIKKEDVWEEMGPKDFPGDSTEYNYTGTGPIESLIIHPLDTSIYIANSAYGGLFVSENGGESWRNAGSDLWNRSLCAWFDIHPFDPNILIAISIEDPMATGGTIGFKGGIMLSKNLGRTWNKIGSYTDFNENPEMWAVNIKLSSDNECFLATNNGLYYIKDIFNSSTNWELIKSNCSISDIALSENNLLVSSKEFGSNKWSIHKYSFKDSKKWKEIKFTLNEEGLSQIGFASNFDGDDFYFLARYEKKSDFIVWVDKQGVSKILNSKMASVFGSGRAFAVNPFDSNCVFAGHGVGLRRSEDRGETWKVIRGDFHVDIENIMFHPYNENELYICTHGGIFKSDDLGESWSFHSKGIGNAEVMGLGVGSESGPIAVGLFHDGSLIFKDTSWQHKAMGDGLNSYVAKDSSQYVYISNQHGSGGLLGSVDSGETFRNINQLSKYRTSGWSMSFEQNPKQKDLFYFNYKRSRTSELKEGYDIVLSRNRGFEEYHQISDFHRTHQFNHYNIYNIWTNPVKPGTIYIYLLDFDSDELQHRVFKNDSTLSFNYDQIMNYWEEIPTPNNKWIGDLEVNPLKEEELFFIYGTSTRYLENNDFGEEMVYKIDLTKKVNCGLGRNCKDITWNLPNSNIEKLGAYIDPIKNRLYVGTSEGLYFLDYERMDDWKKLGGNLPNSIIREIDISSDQKYLYIGTRGRGVWRIKN